jgi:hypothetical protein
MTNSEIREWYLQKIATIPQLNAEWIKQQVPLKERARRAWKIRHDARVEARNLMADRVAVAMIRARDLLVYGHPDGPTFEQLVAAARRRGLMRGLTEEEAYGQIISGAQSTNEWINRAVLGGKSKPPNRPKRPN